MAKRLQVVTTRTGKVWVVNAKSAEKASRLAQKGKGVEIPVSAGKGKLVITDLKDETRDGLRNVTRQWPSRRKVILTLASLGGNVATIAHFI